MAKTKVPKRVAGVKVPKKLRKQAKRAIDFIESPAARELALAGLAAAAETLIERRHSKRTAKAAAEEAPRKAGGVRPRPATAAKGDLAELDLGEVLRAAAAEGARRFLEGFEEGQREARPAKAAGAKPKRRKARVRTQ